MALVTGGGSGIGFEVARQFGKHGAGGEETFSCFLSRGLVLMGRRKEFLEEAVKLLAKEGLRAVLLGVT